MGASRRRIYFKEILPNLWAPLLVYFTLLMPAYVSAEAALSYLGVGIKNPTPTLGNVLDGALEYAYTDFVFFFVPAAIIAAIVISFNLLGDGARDALDPRAGRCSGPHKLSTGKKRRSRRDTPPPKEKTDGNQSEAAGSSSRIHGRRRRPGRLRWDDGGDGGEVGRQPSRSAPRRPRVARSTRWRPSVTEHLDPQRVYVGRDISQPRPAGLPQLGDLPARRDRRGEGPDTDPRPGHRHRPVQRGRDRVVVHPQGRPGLAGRPADHV